MNFVYNRRHTERPKKNWATAERRKKRKLCNACNIRVNGYNRDRHNRQKVEVIKKLNYRAIFLSQASLEAILTAQSQTRPEHMWVVDKNTPPYTLSINVNWIKTKFKLVSMNIKNYRGGKTAAKNETYEIVNWATFVKYFLALLCFTFFYACGMSWSVRC